MYGIAPGLELVHASIAEQTLLKAKLQQVLGLGVSKFAFLFDDIPDKMHDEDIAKFGNLVRLSYASRPHFCRCLCVGN